MKSIAQSVTEAINKNEENHWATVYYLNNSPINSGFIIDSHRCVYPDFDDYCMMRECEHFGAREGLHIRGKM